jgi:hypothetical protein
MLQLLTHKKAYAVNTLRTSRPNTQQLTNKSQYEILSIFPRCFLVGHQRRGLRSPRSFPSVQNQSRDGQADRNRQVVRKAMARLSMFS